MKCIKWEINSKSQISRTDELVLQEQTPCSGRVSIVGVFSNNYRGVIMAAGENSMQRQSSCCWSLLQQLSKVSSWLQEKTPCSGRIAVVGVCSNNYRGVIMAAGENSPASFYGGIFAVLDLQRPNSLFGICYTSIFSKGY